MMKNMLLKLCYTIINFLERDNRFHVKQFVNGNTRQELIKVAANKAKTKTIKVIDLDWEIFGIHRDACQFMEFKFKNLKLGPGLFPQDLDDIFKKRVNMYLSLEAKNG